MRRLAALRLDAGITGDADQPAGSGHPEAEVTEAAQLLHPVLPGEPNRADPAGGLGSLPGAAGSPPTAAGSPPTAVGSQPEGAGGRHRHPGELEGEHPGPVLGGPGDGDGPSLNGAADPLGGWVPDDAPGLRTTASARQGGGHVVRSVVGDAIHSDQDCEDMYDEDTYADTYADTYDEYSYDRGSAGRGSADDGSAHPPDVVLVGQRFVGDESQDEPGDSMSDGDESDDDEPVDDDPDSGPGDDAEIRAKRLRHRPWGRLAELWVPESLRDARVDPGRRGVLVLLLVAALAAVATAFGVWRDRPEPRPVQTVALAPVAGATNDGATTIGATNDGATNDGATGSGTEPSPSAASPGASRAVHSPTGTLPATASATAAPSKLVVSVTGLVAKPGLVTIAPGSRVADAIAAAGGATAEADLTGLNLAARLSDGDSVVIAVSSAPGGGGSGVSSTGIPGGAAPIVGATSGNAAGTGRSELVDLNTADAAALDSLPGVGPVMAQNILAWREQNGRFTSIEQLQEISGIGPARYAQISALVMVS